MRPEATGPVSPRTLRPRLASQRGLALRLVAWVLAALASGGDQAIAATGSRWLELRADGASGRLGPLSFVMIGAVPRLYREA